MNSLGEHKIHSISEEKQTKKNKKKEKERKKSYKIKERKNVGARPGDRTWYLWYRVMNIRTRVLLFYIDTCTFSLKVANTPNYCTVDLLHCS